MVILPFGDTATATSNTDEIKIGLNTFDELEYDCWNLILKYADMFGIQIDAEDEIDFYAAKEVQGSVLKLFTESGFKLKEE
jgi:hypothetical protein